MILSQVYQLFTLLSLVQLSAKFNWLSYVYLLVSLGIGYSVWARPEVDTAQQRTLVDGFSFEEDGVVDAVELYAHTG